VAGDCPLWQVPRGPEQYPAKNKGEPGKPIKPMPNAARLVTRSYSDKSLRRLQGRSCQRNAMAATELSAKTAHPSRRGPRSFRRRCPVRPVHQPGPPRKRTSPCNFRYVGATGIVNRSRRTPTAKPGPIPHQNGQENVVAQAIQCHNRARLLIIQMSLVRVATGATRIRNKIQPVPHAMLETRGTRVAINT